MENPDVLALIEDFFHNIDDENYLKKYIGLPSWIHLSPKRRMVLLSQIAKKQNRSQIMTEEMWDKFASKYIGTPQADSLFSIIEFGLSNEEHSARVLELIIQLISKPSLRLFLEPLLEETLFSLRCPPHPLLVLLSYYTSFKWTFDKGTLSWNEIITSYNSTVLRFQNIINQFDSSNPLVYSNISDFNTESTSSILLSLSNTNPIAFKTLKEEFMINPELDDGLSALALSNVLQPPHNPISDIPKFIIPSALPPPNLPLPFFQKHAVCLDDAMLQIFHHERYILAQEIDQFLRQVAFDLHPDNEYRYSPYAIPLISSPSHAKGPDSSFSYVSLFFDHLYFQYDFSPFQIGDILYAIQCNYNLLPENLNELKDQKNSNKTLLNALQEIDWIQYIPLTVIQIINDSTVVVKVESDKALPDSTKVCVRLSKDLMTRVKKILKLPEVLKATIAQPIKDSFVGFKTETKPISVIIPNNPYASAPLDAANWLSTVYKHGQRTAIFATDSHSFDEFVLQLQTKLHIPSIHILRRDLMPEVTVNKALETRKMLLEVGSNNPDDAPQSLIIAANALRLEIASHPNPPPQAFERLHLLEQLRPLEIIEDNQKRVDYFERDMSNIVCYPFNSSPISHSFDNLIVLPSSLIDNASLLSMIASTSPSNVRVYAPSPAAERLKSIPDIFSQSHYSDISKRSKAISELLEIDPQGETEIAGIITPVAHISCQLKDCDAVSKAASFLLRQLGYETLEINNENEGNEKFALYDAVLIHNLENGIKWAAKWAKSILWSIGPENVFGFPSVVLALGERKGDKIEDERVNYEIENGQFMMALAASVQDDLQELRRNEN